MKRLVSFKRCVLPMLLLGAMHWSAVSANAGPVPLLTQNFDDVTNLVDWAQINNSSPLGLTDWFQGNDGVFPAQSGAANSYIAANFLNSFDGDISNWLLLPELTLGKYDQLSFYTRSGGAFPDNLEVRWSTNGASANVGATGTSVGDFGTLFLTINPTLGDSGYPTGWTKYTVDLGSLAGDSGRLAFRYTVPAATATTLYGDYVGIDTVVVQAVPEPGTLVLLALGTACLTLRRRQGARNTMYEQRGA